MRNLDESFLSNSKASAASLDLFFSAPFTARNPRIFYKKLKAVIMFFTFSFIKQQVHGKRLRSLRFTRYHYVNFI